ncbi:SCP2 sterol-binding domain-containing protein [Nocardioides marmorisolisilvae]|uniref:Sterol carrier protein n=1 Tax=Nocardioides marmorisolisilvae TaxID=1542737 RepID=A0A3N0DX93_9ACTN|nr:SCP2 sterol-binding domain-containing protein [Nocardioides marmorisolisilvae]RNL80181.1 sterol carrier protein [Nocardioides marmorisolisilvae]
MTATFADTDEAAKYIGSVFQAGFDDPQIRTKLEASGLVLRMEISDPDLVMTVDMHTGSIVVGDTELEPNMTLTLSSDTANRFWQGKVGVPLAVARGQIKIDGALPKLLALLPSAKTLNARYIARLEADGRSDLLA